MFEIRGKQIELLNHNYRLDLTYSQVTDAELVSLKGQTVHQLGLSGSIYITDAGMIYLQSMTELIELALAYTRIGNEGLKILGSLLSLESLDVAFTQVTDSGLVHLKDLKRLLSLDVCGWNITPAGLNHLKVLLSPVLAKERAKSPNPPEVVTHADLEGDGLIELRLCIPQPNDEWIDSLRAFGTLSLLVLQFDKHHENKMEAWTRKLHQLIPEVEIQCGASLRIPSLIIHG